MGLASLESQSLQRRGPVGMRCPTDRLAPVPTVRVRDVEIYYELCGEGEPLVFIGGLGADVSLYSALVGELAKKRRVISFDNRGSGRTSKPDSPYSVAMFAEDTAGLMDVLGLATVDVAGMSMGGRIALELVATHPERVQRLVLISTSAAGTGKVHMSFPMRVLWLLQWIPRMQGKPPQPRFAHRRQRTAGTTYDGTGTARMSGTAPAPGLVRPAGLHRARSSNGSGSQQPVVQPVDQGALHPRTRERSRDLGGEALGIPVEGGLSGHAWLRPCGHTGVGSIEGARRRRSLEGGRVKTGRARRHP